MLPGTYLSSLVKMGLVNAEILLIRTNVAMTNIARTNVSPQLETILDVPRNLSLKFG